MSGCERVKKISRGSRIYFRSELVIFLIIKFALLSEKKLFVCCLLIYPRTSEETDGTLPRIASFENTGSRIASFENMGSKIVLSSLELVF